MVRIHTRTCVIDESVQEYIRLLVQFHLEKGVEGAFAHFQSGLFCLLNQDLLRAMSPDELHLLICGTTELNFRDLKEGTRYWLSWNYTAHFASGTRAALLQTTTT